jgi:hypothetical protein
MSELKFELHQLSIILKIFKDKKKDFINKQSNKYKALYTTESRKSQIGLKKIKSEENSLACDINFEIDFNSCFNEFLKERKINNPKWR